jgi:tripartite-type tricarboxylate transporter receptor subunit TctC
MKRRHFNLSLLATAAVSSAAWAQKDPAAGYPGQGIRLVVPYPAGGSTDALARLIANRLREEWNQAVLVDNRPGAGGLLGNDLVAKAQPDGYTVLLAISAIVQAPALYPKVPYDVHKDLAPVAQLALSSNLLVVRPDFPAATLAEFLALAKANPGKYSYGSFGNGTSSHIHGEMLKKQANVDLTHIPYKGSAPLLNDLLGGQVSAGLADGSSARPHLAAGKLKALAATGEKRSKAAPNAPTLTELGYRDFEPYGFFSVFVPAATPKPIVAKLSAQLVKIVMEPAIAARIEQMGIQAEPLAAPQFAQIVKRDAQTWATLIRGMGIRID